MDRLPVINVAGRGCESQSSAAVVDGQMSFKAIKPAHCRLATCYDAVEDTVPIDPFIARNFDRCRVDKTDAGDGARASRYEVSKQRHGHARQASDESRVVDEVGKIMSLKAL